MPRVTLSPAQIDALVGAARAVLAEVEPDFVETWPSARVEALSQARDRLSARLADRHGGGDQP